MGRDLKGRKIGLPNPAFPSAPFSGHLSMKWWFCCERGQARLLLMDNAGDAGLSPCRAVWFTEQAISLPPASLPSSQAYPTSTSHLSRTLVS